MQNTTDNIFVLVIIATGGTFLMVASFILIYIRNQAKIFKQRQQMQQAQIDHQKELLQVVIESQEQERTRVGRDLHDDVGAAISSLRLMVETFDPSSVDTYHNFVSSAKKVIDKMMADVRGISHNLAPSALRDYGLEAAIEEQCIVISKSGKLDVSFTNESQGLLADLPAPVASALYRVLEELLNNTMKHAKATRSVIKFVVDNNMLTIEYSDNGIGMNDDATAKGMGLQNIESRLTVINANYYIVTTPGKGFFIQIKYPLT